MNSLYKYSDWIIESLLHGEIGRRLRIVRKERGLTQQELSDRIRLSRSTITNIENGVHCTTIYTLYELCSALDIDIHKILPSNKYNSPAV